MWIVEIILLSYFIYVVLYTAAFAFGGLFFYKSINPDSSGRKLRFCVLIPSYKEDAVILDSAKKNLLQSFPAEYFDIVVIADSLQPATITELRNLPIKVIEVSFESSTKVKSLNTALNQLPEEYDYAVILDADNIMARDFLERMNGILLHGYKAVQGQRKPKNLNNTLSFLDGVSEAINNHIYRQGSAALNLSASINGSGIAFDFRLLKQKLDGMNSIGGFDRELELLLIREGVSVQYFKSAVVLDEKVSQTNAFQNQRKRWISSQYFYLRKYFGEGMRALFKGDFVFFNSAVLRNIQLPRLINIGLLTLLTVVFFFLKSYLFIGHEIWLGLFAINTIAILISIPQEFYTRQLLLSIVSLPLLFIKMFALLFKLKGANKKFIHTPHGVAGEPVK